MKKVCILISVIAFCGFFFKRSSISPKERKWFFQGGEYSRYDVSYSIFDAGEFFFTTDTIVHNINSKKCYKTTLVGKTKGIAGLFAKINDTLISYIDTSNFQSVKFTRDQQENNYTFLANTEYERENNLVNVYTRVEYNRIELHTYTTTGFAQDLIATYFDLRAVDVNKYKKNDTLFFDIFETDTTFRVPLKFIGRDKIRTIFGRVQSLVFSPIMPKTKNTIFSGENPIRAYISDDYNRIPLKVIAETKYGDIEIILKDYKKPLRNSLYKF